MGASSASDAPRDAVPAREALGRRVAAELAAPAPEAARVLSDAVRARHGDVFAAICFYGSCLRRHTGEGVLDFYALVDRTRDVYGARPAGWLARALPPNVHYLECPAPGDGGETLRVKYAVLTLADFERLCGPRSWNPYVWARFAQPVRLLHARDARARARVEAACTEAVVTFVRRLVAFQPERFASRRFWEESLARTYTTEFRSESPERIAALYGADPARYDAALEDALRALAEEGWLADARREGDLLRALLPDAQRRAARRRFAWTRPLARTLAALRLAKTPVTFDGWAPYAVWKLERHTGSRLDVSPRQLRHPWIHVWPVLFRLLVRRQLR